jgi:hypothetical protein
MTQRPPGSALRLHQPVVAQEIPGQLEVLAMTEAAALGEDPRQELVVGVGHPQIMSARGYRDQSWRLP